MQTTMRRQDRKLQDTETLSILAKGEYGVLSMCTIENGGYGIPLSYAVWNDSIYFHCALEGAKLDLIRRNNRVSFCVVGKTEILPSEFGTKYESAIVFGRAVEVEGEEKREALTRLVEKYSPDFIREGIRYIDDMFDKARVIRIPIEHMSGKARKE